MRHIGRTINQCHTTRQDPEPEKVSSGEGEVLHLTLNLGLVGTPNTL